MCSVNCETPSKLTEETVLESKDNDSLSYVEVGHKAAWDSQTSFILYSERYSVLFSFCLLTLSSSWQWITWAPLNSTRLLCNYWKLSDDGQGLIDELSAVYMYIFVPGSFLALYLLVNHLGLRRGLIVGGVLNTIGSIIRYFGHASYQLVYIGTIVCAIAQCFTLSTPPLLAGLWFGSHERGTATAIGVLANQLGVALGLGATIVFDFLDENSSLEEIDDKNLVLYLRIQMITAALGLSFVFIFVRSDKPPTPPSLAAHFQRENRDNETLKSEYMLSDHQFDIPIIDERTPMLLEAVSNEIRESIEHLDYVESIFKAFQDPPTVAFAFVFGLQVGVFYTIPTFLPQIVTQWSLKEIGWLGLSYQCSGVVGTFLIGKLMDRFQNYKVLMKCLVVISMLSISCLIITNHFSNLALSPSWSKAQNSYQNLLVFIFSGLTGLSLASLNTIGFEYGTAISFPSDEAAISGLMECLAELCGFVLVTFGGQIANVNTLFFIMLGVLFVSQGILISFPLHPRRPKF